MGNRCSGTSGPKSPHTLSFPSLLGCLRCKSRTERPQPTDRQRKDWSRMQCVLLAGNLEKVVSDRIWDELGIVAKHKQFKPGMPKELRVWGPSTGLSDGFDFVKLCISTFGEVSKHIPATQSEIRDEARRRAIAQNERNRNAMMGAQAVQAKRPPIRQRPADMDAHWNRMAPQPACTAKAAAAAAQDHACMHMWACPLSYVGQ